MELRHLRYFIAVAEELNFSRAAERLHIAQPPLSRQIQQLEDEVGVRLLVRDRRKVVLTAEGTKFLREVRKVIAQVEHTLNVIQPAKLGESGTVRVGVATFLTEKIAPVLTEHVKRFPKVEIVCKDLRSPHQNRALIEGSIDVGFLRPPVGRGLTSEHVFDEPIRVLVAKTNPLSKLKAVRMKDLVHETLLLPERQVPAGIFDKVLELFRKAGPNARIVQTETGPFEETGTMLVASGKGIYLVSGSSSYRSFDKQVTTIPLVEPNALFEVHVAWRKAEKSQAVLKLLETVRNVFKPARTR